MGYTGHQHDRETGLTYAQAHYYDAAVGRFLSADPIDFTGAPQSFNRYGYANNNPYRYTDPTGMCSRAVGISCGPDIEGLRGDGSRLGGTGEGAPLGSTGLNSSASSATPDESTPSSEDPDMEEFANGVTTMTSVNEDTGDHKYQIRGSICGGTPGCDESLADRDYGHVNQNDVPFTSDDLGTGVRRLMGFQPIFHSEDIQNRTSVNITLEGHWFHPGDVTRRVHIVGPTLYYDVTGTGTGQNPSFNNWLGVELFRPGVQDVVN